MLAVSHRQDLHKSRYIHEGISLRAPEAETIADGAAKLKQLLH